IVGTNFNEIKPTQTVINRERVDDYIKKLKAGAEVEPIIVYDVPGKGRFIEEGHHRYIASQETGIPVKIVVRNGNGPTGLSDWSHVEWKPYVNDGQFFGD
ncbi:ParB N-terminal domain-containing protein, partial [Acetonema longum]|uniref:ParB N-terminal domain-containing protein n=1 Tax=Acetonema longum TaxID=2374 RepID=UPI00058EEF65